MAITAASQQPDLREPAWRRTSNQIATALMVLAFVLVIIPLGFVLYTVIAKGASVISWSFLTSPIPPIVLPANVGGIGPGGTRHDRDHRPWPRSLPCRSACWARSTSTSTAARVCWRGSSGSSADVMTGVPSIVMGLFIFSIWVLHFGFSGLAGAFALGCLMLPIVISSTVEMLKLVPDALREASYALGATKARVTMTVVLPTAIGGIVSGALLAVARAAGETAPLLFTILTVTTANPNVFSGANTALPSQIFVNASSPYAGAQSRGWGAALTLIVIAFVLLVVARFVTARFTRLGR